MARVPARQSMGFGHMFGSRGGRGLPAVILLLIVATAALSILGAVGQRHEIPLVSLSMLVPAAVLHGQAWRLFSWVFFELDPMTLVFACLALFWFGRDLATRWGTGRFVVSYLALAATIGGLTVLASLVYPTIKTGVYVGSWAILDALIILWASYYPAQQIMMMFVLPMSGQRIVYFTIGVTVLLSLFHGLDPYIPNFLAEGLALAIVALPSPRELWIERKLRSVEQTRSKATHLRSVPRDSGPRDDTPSGDGQSGRWLN